MTELGAPARRRVGEILARAAELGWLGPGPVDAQVDHALAMARAVAVAGGSAATAPVETGNPGAIVDLGSGGGVPGLVIAVVLAPRPVTLLEGSTRRAAFLRSAADELADLAVVDVAEGRAEELARRPDLDGHFVVATARSFGRPAVVAECAARLLAVGGILAVSEPPEPGNPGDGDNTARGPRWDAAGLGALGFGAVRTSSEHGVRIAMTQKSGFTDSRYPRRVGIPAKRPLW